MVTYNPFFGSLPPKHQKEQIEERDRQQAKPVEGKSHRKVYKEKSENEEHFYEDTTGKFIPQAGPRKNPEDEDKPSRALKDIEC